MKKLNAVLSVGELVTAVITIVILGALMYTMTDFAVVNASRNGSVAITAMMAMLPLLTVVIVVISMVKFHSD
jgi:hypothetical protein